jgi:phosphate-selective porin OprO/OprP
MRKSELIAVGLGVLLAFPVSGQEDLRTKVDDLEQQLKILKRQLENDKEASAEKAKATPTLSVGAGGVVFQSADTNFVLKLKGTVQVDARFYPNDPPSTKSLDTFLIRRARPVIEGTAFKIFDYRMMFDFVSNETVAGGNNNPILQDIYVNARLEPWFQVQVGKFKEPLSLDRLQQDANLLFVERSYTSQIAPNRDIGGMVQGQILDGAFSYALGAFNGSVDGGSDDIETVDGDKDVAGRVFAQPFLKSKIEPLRKLGFGVAGTFGHHEGALGSVVTPGQQPLFSWGIPAAGATPATTVVADGNNWRLAPQGYWYYGPFGLLGEYIISDQTVRKGAKTRDTFRNQAWFVGASYFLTGEENQFNAVTPLHSFHPSEREWGAFELAARAQEVSLDDRIFRGGWTDKKTSTSEAFTWGVGLNWHLNRNVKFMFDFDRTDFKGGTSALLKKGENVVLTRAQLAF